MNEPTNPIRKEYAGMPERSTSLVVRNVIEKYTELGEEMEVSDVEINSRIRILQFISSFRDIINKNPDVDVEKLVDLANQDTEILPAHQELLINILETYKSERRRLLDFIRHIKTETGKNPGTAEFDHAILEKLGVEIKGSVSIKYLPLGLLVEIPDINDFTRARQIPPEVRLPDGTAIVTRGYFKSFSDGLQVLFYCTADESYIVNQEITINHELQHLDFNLLIHAAGLYEQQELIDEINGYIQSWNKDEQPKENIEFSIQKIFDTMIEKSLKNEIIARIATGYPFEEATARKNISEFIEINRGILLKIFEVIANGKNKKSTLEFILNYQPEFNKFINRISAAYYSAGILKRGFRLNSKEYPKPPKEVADLVIADTINKWPDLINHLEGYFQRHIFPINLMVNKFIDEGDGIINNAVHKSGVTLAEIALGLSPLADEINGFLGLFEKKIEILKAEKWQELSLDDLIVKKHRIIQELESLLLRLAEKVEIWKETEI